MRKHLPFSGLAALLFAMGMPVPASAPITQFEQLADPEFEIEFTLAN